MINKADNFAVSDNAVLRYEEIYYFGKSEIHKTTPPTGRKVQIPEVNQNTVSRLCGLVVRVRFSALSDFLISSGYGTRSTQPREYN
jgi:hypothetical protein